MLQCKIITGKDAASVEEKINDFLRKNSKIIIHTIRQSARESLLFVSIFFETRSRRQKDVLRDAAIEKISVPLPDVAGDAN